MRIMLAVLMMALLVVAACGPKAPAAGNETNKTTETPEATVPEEAPRANTTEVSVKKAPSAEPTGAMVAVVKAHDADALAGVTAINLSFRKLEIQAANSSRWIPVFDQTARANLMALGDGAFELGLNNVPAQKYKAIRLQLKTGGDVYIDDALGAYSVPNDYLQVVKEFEVAQDETLTFVLDIDLASSATLVEGNIVLKPNAKVSLLSGAASARQGGGIVTLSGGTERFRYDKTYEQLLPPGTLEKAVADCKEACPGTCSGKAEACTTECKDAVASGCQVGGRDCRDKCDPYLPPVKCRDNCEESISTCQSNLLSECGISCQGKYAAPCIASCEAACAS